MLIGLLASLATSNIDYNPGNRFYSCLNYRVSIKSIFESEIDGCYVVYNQATYLIINMIVSLENILTLLLNVIFLHLGTKNMPSPMPLLPPDIPIQCHLYHEVMV